jgi:sirohydrochlorin cobaltochelatase
MKSALILFAHGARDPRWAEPFQRLRQLLQKKLPETSVSLAFLELMNPRLPEVMAQLAEERYTKAIVVPVFFGQGGHLLRDLPIIIDELRLKHPELELSVAKAVGEDEGVLNAIAEYFIAAMGSPETR